MPARDGTGPFGQNFWTSRGMGHRGSLGPRRGQIFIKNRFSRKPFSWYHRIWYLTFGQFLRG
ncbi:hypothetical protein ATC1_11366 [Flexilinea flocculi]|uniref:Uncharacterized protein n=1 Tax=Flexilinea flocculi TaxID=1678840 RepID=A0A0K8P9V0_9CHLR|nr:hypothetical protein ATC1_11366 [Flexilinea flocculi]